MLLIYETIHLRFDQLVVEVYEVNDDGYQLNGNHISAPKTYFAQKYVKRKRFAKL